MAKARAQLKLNRHQHRQTTMPDMMASSGTKSSSLIDRIQQKFSIAKESMQLHRVPALKQVITDAQLEDELARM